MRKLLDYRLGRALWLEGLDRGTIARRLGTTPGTVTFMAWRDNWPKRGVCEKQRRAAARAYSRGDDIERIKARIPQTVSTGTLRRWALELNLPPRPLTDSDARKKSRKAATVRLVALAKSKARMCRKGCGGRYSGRNAHCNVCGATRIPSPDQKRQQRWNGTHDKRRSPAWYTTMKAIGRGYGQAIDAKRKAKNRATRRTTRPAEWWLNELANKRPDRYDPTLSRAALLFRAHYYCDPEFRAKQIMKARAREFDRERVSDGSITTAVLMRLFAAAKDCPYCGKAMTSNEKTLDHLVPIAKGGHHTISNVVVACWPCNHRKGAKLLPDHYLQQIRSANAA